MRNHSFRSAFQFILSLVLVSFLLFGSVGQASAAAIFYVRAGATGTGTSWGNAYGSLQTALKNAPAGSGIQIWVAKGTYKPTTGACTLANKTTKRKTSFKLKSGVQVYGGFAGSETSLAQRKPTTNVTILSGDICVVNNKSDNSYRVVDGSGTSASTILDGFTIKAGNASGSTSFGEPSSGGGMYIVNGRPTLRNLVFTGNAAAEIGGGGMYNQNSSPKLTNVTFKGNNSNNFGGGMYNYNNSNPVLVNVRFIGNHAAYGGGMYNLASSPRVTKVTFTTNGSSSTSTTLEGGGMYNGGGSQPVLSSVTFGSNSARSGGGMSNEGSSPTLTNVVFNANQSSNISDGGGGMYNNNGSAPTLRNVTFSSNHASNGGGGVYNNGSSHPSLLNVTFSGNSADVKGGAIANQSSYPTLNNTTLSGNTAPSGDGMYNNSSTPYIYNSIIYGNGTVAILNELSSMVTITDSIVEGADLSSDCLSDLQSSCTNVRDADPNLGALAKNGGFTRTMALGADSPAIDTGGVINACIPGKDQRGVGRPQGGKCDMGAYEVRVMSFTSVGAYDGQIVAGGAVNSNLTSFSVGDNAANKQVRGFLSFDTSGLPDTAALVMAQVKVKSTASAGSPFSTLGLLTLDLAKPYFGTQIGLVAGDFNVAPTVLAAGSVSPVPLAGNWYVSTLLPTGRANVNKIGTTQLRLKFATATNGDSAVNSITFSSGEAVAASRPVLSIYYNP